MTHFRPTDFAVSFRDPSGFFWINEEGRALRCVFPDQVQDIQFLLKQKPFEGWIQSNKVIQSRILDNKETQEVIQNTPFAKDFPLMSEGIILEHRRILFPSYPYEWSPLMLYEAGLLTLELAEKSLDFGYSLKDATPYNILFDGNPPCFVDILSFEKRNLLDGTWKPYAQFIRNFILPLLAQKYLGSSLKEIFLITRDGISSDRIYKELNFVQKLLPRFFSLVTLPQWLGKRKQESTSVQYQPKLFSSPEQAKFVLKMILNNLRKKLVQLKPKSQSSTWTQYAECSHCTPEYSSIKEKWIHDFLKENFVQNVLDLGSNLGTYSKIFAKKASSVVSVDIDPEVIDLFWNENKRSFPNILTLNMDLAWPSPALGWEYRLTKTFLQRSAGYFDTVLMYAIVHHLMITHQIPLELIVNLSQQLTQKWLIIEYIGFKDPLFQRLLRGREDLYKSYSEDYFEKCFTNSFEIIRKQKIPNMDRSLYLMKRK